MIYRPLGRTGITVSEIGMGLEHLLDKDAQTVADTIRAAIDGGVTYLDCHPGHDFKEETVGYAGFEKLGKAIAGQREKLCLSYIAHAGARKPTDAAPHFESYLKALGTDRTDIFIIQFCDRMTDFEQVCGEGGILDYAKELVAQGKARHIGISTHSAAVAIGAVENGAFDVIMYPVNPAFDVVVDEERYKTDQLDTLWDAAYDFAAEGKRGAQPRKEVYSACARAGVAIVAMKPFAGGFIFRVEETAGFTPVNLIAYALAQNGISTVVPGCTQPREINEILTYTAAPEEARDYSGAVARSRWSVMENCLYCNHCLPCGAGINIGQVNRLLDAARTPTELESARKKYRALDVKASACINCGVCEERCPFKVPVIERMRRAVEMLEA